jgi:hypothetical protein
MPNKCNATFTFMQISHKSLINTYTVQTDRDSVYITRKSNKLSKITGIYTVLQAAKDGTKDRIQVQSLGLLKQDTIRYKLED